MNSPLVFRVVSRLFLIVLFLGTFFPQTPLWAMSSAQNAPNAPDAFPLQIPLTGVVQIAANGDFTCVLTNKGGVKCWGFNNQGQLGDGTTETRLTAVDVSGLGSGVKAIAAGSIHACALLTGGGVKCWGNNSAGQIGDGTSGTNRLTPVDVSGITNAVAISTGEYHSCAVLADGVAKCWGSNTEGQIGDGTSGTTRLTPVAVFGITNAVSISASRFNSCVVLIGGGVKCWGDNDEGQIGDGTEDTDRLMPTDVLGLSSNVKSVVLGQYNACALLTNGNVKCWGANGSGAVGNDSNVKSLIPVDVYGMEARGDGEPNGVSAITLGEAHVCAVTSNGGVKCWGNNLNRQLGDGTKVNRNVPTDVIGMKNAVAVAVGYSHTCALLNSGGVQCWGSGQNGQLGDNIYLHSRGLPADVTVPATCFALTLSHSGNGVNPAPTPSQSQDCPPSSYLAGTQIALIAAPDADNFVKGWSGSNNNSSRDFSNLLTMPAADRTLSVTYAPCRTLALTHSGDGGNPVAIPGHSQQCTSGKYAPNEIIALLATPAENARVKSWVGAAQNPAAGSVNNTLAMPDANSTVSVTYEACVALTAAIEGQGNLLQMTPTATFGCDPSSFIAGQTVTLLAAPANGWHIASWIGTTNDQSTATSNSVVIGNEATQVGIIYVKDEVPKSDIPIFLPSIRN